MCYAAVYYAAVIIAGAVTAKSQVDQARYEKDVADYNAAVDRNQAVEVRNEARIQENEERQRAFELISRQRAVLASRGANIDFGTALQIQEDTALIGEINAMRIRESGEEQATALESRAELTESSGDFALKQGKLAAVGTVFSTIGSLGGAAGSLAGSAPKQDTGSVAVAGTTQGSQFSLSGQTSGSFAGQGGNTAVASRWFNFGST